MSDVLAKYPVQQVHGWYLRLAAMVGKKKVQGHQPLAAQFLNAYLTNKKKGATITFAAPGYLQGFAKVQSALLYHRKVFLTEQKARIGKSTLKWAGAIPRLQDGRWSGNGALPMHYESLVEIGSGYTDVIRIQTNGTPEERDLFTSLRGFQMRSDVILKGTRNGNAVAVTFAKWAASARDTYDFDFSEHLTMPNPDFGSKAANAIAPGSRSIRVYHKNAQRMEKAGLAAPYKVVVGPWTVTTRTLLAPATLDAAKKLP